MFTYAAALSQAVPAATVYVPGRSVAYENQALMEAMKTTRLAEIFRLPIYLLYLFMMDFYNLQCREVYKIQLLCSVLRSGALGTRRELCLF